MTTITTRAGKGAELTHAEMDANFNNLNTDKIETSVFPNVASPVTADQAELNKLDGMTSSQAELNLLTGVTASTSEINFLTGVTSNIQTQLDSKASSSTIGWVECGRVAVASPTSSVTFVDGVSGVVFDSTYNEYRVIVEDYSPDVTLRALDMQFTVNGGVSWDSSNNYPPVFSGYGRTNAMRLIAATDNTGYGSCAFYIINKDGPSAYTRRLYGESTATQSSGAFEIVSGIAGGYKNSLAPDGIKFFPSSDLIATGTFILQGRNH